MGQAGPRVHPSEDDLAEGDTTGNECQGLIETLQQDACEEKEVRSGGWDYQDSLLEEVPDADVLRGVLNTEDSQKHSSSGFAGRKLPRTLSRNMGAVTQGSDFWDGGSGGFAFSRGMGVGKDLTARG